MRGASAAELAQEIHRHITKQLRLGPGFAWATLQEVDYGTPNTLQVTLQGSSTVIVGVRYGSWYTPPSPSTPDLLLVYKLGDGDYLVAGDMA